MRRAYAVLLALCLALTGALATADGSWCWRGDLPVTARLRDLVS